MNRLQKFMMGRYGVDELYYFLFTVSIVLTFISMFTGWHFLDLLSMIILFFATYRIFSRNINRRYQENMKFLNMINPVKRKVRYFINKLKSRKYYRYFYCPQCRQELRIPKGKGNVLVTCPKCQAKFKTRT